ncbi:MAG TPA: DUF211 domain-containing protein [Candidatus Norongarragalinales archaeon]|nr:DUF211 domain-containing protein [Candidatus Norongarragalinales archaeon]
MLKLKEITLEILKPSDLQIIELLHALEKVAGVKKVEITLTDFEKSTETLKVSISGASLDFERVSEVVAHSGGIIQTVQHIVGER